MLVKPGDKVGFYRPNLKNQTGTVKEIHDIGSDYIVIVRLSDGRFAKSLINDIFPIKEKTINEEKFNQAVCKVLDKSTYNGKMSPLMETTFDVLGALICSKLHNELFGERK